MTRFVIPRHVVPSDPDTGLSDLQTRIVSDPAAVRIFSAPTGAGKSYAFERLMRDKGARILFIVPTRRLAQNIGDGLRRSLSSDGLSTDEIDRRVFLWTSDERKRQLDIDPEARIRDLRLDAIRREGPRMILATPESVAWYLLNPGLRKDGQNPETIMDLLRLDHVVFDEFHTIDPRGMGLSCAIASMTAGLSGGCKVTFLSATPIDITAPLTACGIDSSAITIGEETVKTGPASGTPGMRAIHGDVEVSFHEMSIPEILDTHRNLVHSTLCRTDGCDQLVIVFDSLRDLLRHKTRLFGILSGLGYGREHILSINSTDDSVHKELTDVCCIGQANDPLDFKVLVATSSVEMGVTFRAGLIIMDPGHDACSFVQRLGRAARGDVSGQVLIAATQARLNRSPWFRALLLDFTNHDQLDIDTFQDMVLAATRRRFKASQTDLLTETPHTRTFSAMPRRAVWCAGLFWAALENAALYKGISGTLRNSRPQPARVISALLAKVDRAGTRTAHAWRTAFLEEARTLRLIEPKVKLIDPKGKQQTLNHSLYRATPEIRNAPCRFDDKGTLEILLDRPIDLVLSELGNDRIARTEQALLPHRTRRLSVGAGKLQADFTSAMTAEKRDPDIDDAEIELIDACLQLVHLTGIVPIEREAETVVGGHVIV